MRRERSDRLFAKASKLIPGGVNSPVRAFGAVGGQPIFVQRGEGPYLHDADGNRYIDYVGSWGPLILGHAHPAVVEAVSRAAVDGTSFGAATAREVELAERITEAVPSVEKIRFVNSGTEATMSALRLARGATGRDRVIKFAGCYHGHADAFLVEAGSGVATLGLPGCSGVPEGTAADTVVVPYNDLDAVHKALESHRETVAAVIVEPVACNMGLVPPAEGFLDGLRRACDAHGALLIFDEVITGFRLGLSGAQGVFGVRPDLTTFGKIIGGGLPVGAYGGRVDLMDQVAPMGPVYQAGTLSGNPLAMAAGLATLETLTQPGVYENLEAHAASLAEGIGELLTPRPHIGRIDRVGSIFYVWLSPDRTNPARNYEEIKQTDTGLFAKLFHALLQQGIYIAPSGFEVGFVSAAHAQSHIDATVTAMHRALKILEGAS